jgi:molybdopterin synthase catalytic subunit
VAWAEITTEPIDAADLERLVDHPSSGACVSFVGRVREHDGGRLVASLEYSAHPQSEAEALRIAQEVLERVTGAQSLAVSHRIGRLHVGDIAIVCAASAGHRSEAFEACRELIETIKRDLPIWKHQNFRDGTDEWVGSS